MVGGKSAGINTHVGCKRISNCGLTSVVGGAGAPLCVVTLRMACLAITYLDIIDVGVGLQCEDEANQVCSRQQHRNSIDQGPVDSFKINKHS